MKLVYLMPVLFIFGYVEAQSYPPVDVINSNSKPGSHISRTMHLLETSTPDEPNTVKVMIYGQSITRMEWWLIIREHLVQRFPHARIDVRNYAIGGFAAERLIRIVERDILDFYPDLIIFHDYGAEDTYEKIIRMFRTLTTAEVMIMNDHIGLTQNHEWHDRHSWEWLSSICEKYHMELIDVRSNWIDYAEKYGYGYEQFLSDNVHMNAFGNYLMAEIIKGHLVYDPESEPDPLDLMTVRHPEVQRETNSLQIEFEGNRIDLVFDYAVKELDLRIRVNGKHLDAFAGTYTYSRPSIDPKASFPEKIGMPVKINLNENPEEDRWWMDLTSVERDGHKIMFDLYSDKYGSQGSGNNLEQFCSKNGQICLNPEDWFYREEPGFFSPWDAVRAGDTIRFEIFSMTESRLTSLEGKRVTVVKGLPEGRHTLSVEADSPEELYKISKILVFDPFLLNREGEGR